MARIELSERAADWLRNADPDATEQVTKRLERCAEFPDHFLDRLSGSDYYKLRAGDYRAVIQWERNADPEDVLFVRRIGHRDGFYD